MTTVLGLITARGGSKGILRKNLVDLGGKPLIAWTVEAAVEAESLSRILVSTDDQEIADVAVECGAEAPFMRPQELAQDDSAHIPVIQHALKWVEQDEGELPELVCLLQPTSPFRTAEHIDEAVALLKAENADAVVGVCAAKTHPYLVRSVNEQGELEPFVELPEAYLRRQDFPAAYELNGAIYLCRTRVVMQNATLLPKGTLAYVMDEGASLDIDCSQDLELARRHGHY